MSLITRRTLCSSSYSSFLNTNILTKRFSSKAVTKQDLENQWKEQLKSFNEDWKVIKDSNYEGHLKRLSEELGEDRCNYIKAVAEIYSGLNEFQFSYIEAKLKQRLNKEKSLSAISLNTDWPSLVELGEDVPPVNPNFFKQQELMSEFTKWLKTQEGIDLGFGAIASSGAGAAPATSGAAKDEGEAKEAAPKKEKEIIDLVLVSFDTAKKISLIKEVRAITNLGLKESKELVEQIPSTILSKLKRDEAAPHIEKLEAVGGKLEMK